MQISEDLVQPFAEGLDKKGGVNSAAWRDLKLPKDAQGIFIAAERAGVRGDVLTAAAERFHKIQEASKA